MLSTDIRSHFKKFGELRAFEQQVDKATGAQLGVVWVKCVVSFTYDSEMFNF